MHSEIARLMLDFCRQHPWMVVGSILAATAAQVIQSVVVPRLLAKVFTHLKDPQALKKYIAYFLIAFAVGKACNVIDTALDKQIAPLLHDFLVRELSTQVMRSYMATHLAIDVTIMINRIGALRQSMEYMLEYLFASFLPTLASIAITTAAVFAVSAKLGLLVIGSLVVMGIIMYALPRAPPAMVHRDVLTMALEDVFQNLEFVTSSAYGADQAATNIAGRSETACDALSRVNAVNSRNKGVAYAVAAVSYAVSVVYLTHLFIRGEVTTESFEANILTLGRLYELAFNMAHLVPDFIEDWRIIKSLQKFVQQLYAERERTGLDRLVGGSIELDGVSFAHPERPVLFHNFSLLIPAGSMVALVGPSGSGKSTLLAILLGELVPQRGAVYLGGTPLTDLSERAVRSGVAVVYQTTSTLLRMSIYDNMTFGLTPRLGVRAEVEELIDTYGLRRVFGDDPVFLDRVLSKGGGGLSGGQRQIVMLVHAILNKTAHVVVLDEPTSALDPELRGCVVDLIHAVHASGKTVLVVTHDAQVCAMCSIVVSTAPGRNPRVVAPGEEK